MEMRLLARFVGRYSQAFWRAFATGKTWPKQLTKIAIPAVAINLGLGNLGATPVTVPLDSLIGWGLFTMWAAVAAGIVRTDSTSFSPEGFSSATLSLLTGSGNRQR